MTMLEDLKTKDKISREDIAKLLSSIGKPSKNRDEKIAAVKELELSNFQGTSLHETLDSYGEF